MTNEEKLEKYKKILTHLFPEKTGAYFICGEVGEKGVDGLPDKILICPTHGLSGFAVYKKEKDWSEPGW